MTYYGAKDMAASFRTVRKNTITIAEDIGAEHYGFSAAPETRTVAQILAHIALGPRGPRMALQIHATERRDTLKGFDPGFFAKLAAEEQALQTKEQITAVLRDEGDRFASWVEGLSDDFLAESVRFLPGMPRSSKTRFEMILGVKEHEMHHRAQLMLIERMIGIVPHLTREMMARIAAMQASQASA